DRSVEMVQVSPDEKFVTYKLTKKSNPKKTIVPNYVTTSGFTEEISSRPKVGAPLNATELFIYDVQRDTVFQVKTQDLPGITDTLVYLKDYRSKKGLSFDDNKKVTRPIDFSALSWSDNGQKCVVIINALDFKDRWIMLLDIPTQKLTLLYRDHDDAWIGGPVNGGFGNYAIGWMADNKRIWFTSEETGYSHLYTIDVDTKVKQALTSGEFEVQQVTLSRNKDFFYLITNESHPGEKQVYRLQVAGGKPERLTTMVGAHEMVLSPDEKVIALRYSSSNMPWELYLMENKPGAKPQKITNSLTTEFKSYSWRDPDLITFAARDNAKIYARLYRPQQANGAAVIFVHGAGYLQNAHKWWSSYFREYMFHNLLVDKGYTVLDIDYRASSGYGREWRTGIYRHMGGKDLTDNLDGAKLLVEKYNIDPGRIGIYGGSYGGFITLMAMFTAPDVFAAGAALRPVTDWAHYSHSYTGSILNTPHLDSMSYAKSSPLYYAEGLKGALLMCHGMVDTNVHFQDAVRLSQRLIELGKENWELAVYPVEDHGFVEPSSWTDEYKRILKLFEENLKPK
ncbi:MAG: S9 family peptidase, partial [Marivirga sp.]|nr:S9 family peptidase [Marivirga sp.]